MYAGKYNYSIKKKFGSKTGTLEFEVSPESRTLNGQIALKGMTLPIRGKIDGHKIEFYGSYVGKLSTYIFCVGGYTEDDGKTFAGKLEDKRGAKEFSAVQISETVDTPMMEVSEQAE